VKTFLLAAAAATHKPIVPILSPAASNHFLMIDLRSLWEERRLLVTFTVISNQTNQTLQCVSLEFNYRKVCSILNSSLDLISLSSSL